MLLTINGMWLMMFLAVRVNDNTFSYLHMKKVEWHLVNGNVSS